MHPGAVSLNRIHSGCSARCWCHRRRHRHRHRRRRRRRRRRWRHRGRDNRIERGPGTNWNQHRAFYCYVILSVWIFLLVAGMYKYIGIDEKSSIQARVLGNDVSVREYPRNLKADVKTKKIFRFCNPPNEIIAESEGKLDGNLTLGGVLVFIRHGDRGPLGHVRNISVVNCGGDFASTPELEIVYQNYVNFLQNISSYSRTAWAQFLGPFHGFPMLPANSKDCRIGQLTTLGVSQLQEMSDHLKSHPAVGELIRQASNAVFEIPDQAQTMDPNTLKDALLTYVCHGASLPCVDLEAQRICVKTEHVTGLFAYSEWESKQVAKSSNRRKYGLLRAYGLLRNIVSYMLRIISEAKPKIVLYSGHDKTLEYLATALGIFSDKLAMPHYASRFVIEVYRLNSRNENHVASDFYFRVIVNGKDFTQKIPFCRNANFYSASYTERSDTDRVRKDSKLCPIETIIRQLHDDYFGPFNATNFKDACSSRKRG